MKSPNSIGEDNQQKSHLQATTMLSRLPEEIQLEIFMKLPANSILICRCVCKFWYSLLCNPKFVNNHLIQTIQTRKPRFILSRTHLWLSKNPIVYSIDYASVLSSLSLSISTSLSLSMSVVYDDCDFDGALRLDYPFEYKKIRSFNVLGSCNGLICLSIADGCGNPLDNSICIWNPTTREYKEISLPQYPLVEEEYSYQIRYGFGHDSEIGDYKVVRISGSENSPDCFSMKVYTLGLDSWNCIDNPSSYSFLPFTNTCGLLFHGALHWIGKASSKVIVAFKISSERLLDVPLPEVIMVPPENGEELDIHVGVLGDCLCLAVLVRDIRSDVWVMQEYGVRESWTKQFTITQDQLSIRWDMYKFKPIWSFENGEILINTHTDLILYDKVSGRVRKVYFPDTALRGNLDILPKNIESYVVSLVPLKSGTYVEKIFLHT